MPKIIVEIDEFGQPVIKAQGFTGMACKLATASLEAAYIGGADKIKRQNTAELFTTVNHTVVTAGGK